MHQNCKMKSKPPQKSSHLIKKDMIQREMKKKKHSFPLMPQNRMVLVSAVKTQLSWGWEVGSWGLWLSLPLQSDNTEHVAGILHPTTASSMVLYVISCSQVLLSPTLPTPFSISILHAFTEYPQMLKSACLFVAWFWQVRNQDQNKMRLSCRMPASR